jgi:AcrR family transcriptional regulator
VSQAANAAAAAVPPTPTAELLRPMRADARRNREELLTRAGEVFTERGIDASLEEIARRASVGIGTLYRHFPNREVLVEAVYRHEVATLCEGVDDLLAQHGPDEALAIWMRSFAVYVSHKRGMAMALKSLLGADSPLFTESHRRIQEAIGILVAAAVESGSIRADVAPDDLLRAMGGICMAADSPDWADRVGSLIGLLIDGLRYGAPGAVS